MRTRTKMLSVVASSALALNIGTSALTSARAAPSMAAALETKFVYERPAPIGTTTGPEYPNTASLPPFLCKYNRRWPHA